MSCKPITKFIFFKNTVNLAEEVLINALSRLKTYIKTQSQWNFGVLSILKQQNSKQPY